MNRLEFAADRVADQDKGIAYLLPYITRALNNWTADGEWWRPIMTRVREVYLRTLREDTKNPDARDLSGWNEIAQTIRDTLPKTGKPDVGTAKQLATWLSTYAVAAGSETAYHSLGDFEMAWTSMHDKHVRRSHREADGQRRNKGEKFEVGGHKMSRPGDPTAPIEEWINCRCVLVPQVRAENIAASADYEGAEKEIAMSTTAPEKQAADPALGVPWHGVLAPEGVWSGDRRQFGPGSLTFRDLPLPLTWQKTSASGHDGSVVVAKIERLARVDGQMRASGHYLASPEADEALSLVAEFGKFGVSVDADSPSVEFAEADDGGQPWTTFTAGRICSASMVPIPAFAEAYVSLGPPPEGFLPDDCDPASPDYEDCMNAKGAEPGGDTKTGMAVEAKDYSAAERKDAHTVPGTDSYPIEDCADLKNAIQAIGRAKDPAATKRHIKTQKNRLGCPDVEIPSEWAEDADTFADVEQFVDVAPGRTEDGPGWLTHPVDTDRLRDYWVRGPGAAKVGWGTPGDFNRCRALVAEYVKPQFLAGYCANRHYDALGFWPGRAPSEQVSISDDIRFADAVPAPAVSLVASAGWCAPSEWFRDPELDRLSGLRVQEDGRVFGHLAGWDSCHIDPAFKGTCVAPPHSVTDYAYFLTGEILTDEGLLPVGTLTVDTGHAPRGSARRAISHYDNTGAVAAYVTIGEDAHGIWVAGCVSPNATDGQVVALRGAKLSGDWRRLGSADNLELVAALAVNTGGFPIPRTRVDIAAGLQESLVAAGIVDEEPAPVSVIDLASSEEAVQNFARAVERAMHERSERVRQLDELSARIGE